MPSRTYITPGTNYRSWFAGTFADSGLVRLNGIDCPEKGQGYGKRAKQAASDLAFGKDVTLHTFGKDKYGQALFVPYTE